MENTKQSGARKTRFLAPRMQLQSAAYRKEIMPKWFPSDEKPKIKRKIKSKMEKETGLVLPASKFKKLVEEIMEEMKKENKFEKNAMKALQEAAENYLIGMFVSANECAEHCNRVTINSDDLTLFLNLN